MNNNNRDVINLFFERFKKTISSMSRDRKRALQYVFDFVALWAVAWLAYVIRFGVIFVPNLDQALIITAAPAIAIPFFIRFGLYRAILRYIQERVIWTIVLVMSLSTLAWVTLVFFSSMTGGAGVPRSIPIIYWALGIIVIGLSRFAIKALFSSEIARDHGRRLLIYGSSQSGRELAAALRAGGDRSVIGFIDEDPSLNGEDVAGIRVYGVSELAKIIEKHEVTDVVLSMPKADAEKRLQIAAMLRQYPIRLLSIPAISDIATGQYSIGALKEIEIEDLLVRSQVPPDPVLLRTTIAGKTILVTGAGGSIGTALCNLIAQHEPVSIIMLDCSEQALYDIHRHLAKASTVELIPVLGSITDETLVDKLFKDFQIEAVFHAAAYKHVPLVEQNPFTGIYNNVFGSFTLARAAFRAGCPSFVLISSDKAVRPANIMGATKRWSELIIRHFADEAQSADTGQRFCSVRFGNVLGSNGSVVPLFKEQIAAGGPVTVTDPAMTRYFMTIKEAAELIVQAATLSEGGEIFVLDMGEPVAIMDLADNMIRLAGLSVRSPEDPNGEIEIIFTGIRPGEKISEELYYDAAGAVPTQHPKIMKVRQRDRQLEDVEGYLLQLHDALTNTDTLTVRSMLFRHLGQDILHASPENHETVSGH